MSDLRGTPAPAWRRGCLVLGALTAILFGLLLVLSAITGAKDRRTSLALGHRVGVIEIEGEISDARDFLDELKKLEDDPRVAALVVRIDSPGGGVAATQEMYHALRRYREKTGRPVVASFGTLAASGGYYVACAAQKIVTEPGTLTGSIGVVMTFTDAAELLQKIGVRFEVVKSGPKKDFGGFWRPLTEEERAMLQGIVGDVYDQFTTVVAEGRRLPLDRVREIADGRILSGRQAVTAGLADTLGFREDAVRIAAVLAGLSPDTEAISKRPFEPRILDLLRRMSGKVSMLLASGPSLEYR